MDAAALVRQVHDSNRQATDAASRWATHRARVMDKTQAKSLAELVRMAIQLEAGG